MKKFVLISAIVFSFVMFAYLNALADYTELKPAEPHEQGYGIYKNYSCGGGCNWSRCEFGTGECTFDMQHECCRY